jgi:hypothetical protein
MKSELVWLGLGAVGLYFAYTQGLFGSTTPVGPNTVVAPNPTVPNPVVLSVPVGNPPAPNLLADKPLIGGIPGFSPVGDPSMLNKIGMSGTRHYVRVR